VTEFRVERLVKRGRAQPRYRREGHQVGIGPVFRRWPRIAREGSESRFHCGRFFEKKDALVAAQAVIGSPRLRLAQDLVIAHDGLGGEKPKQTKLGEAAEAQTGIFVQPFEPRFRCAVMDMALVKERQPYIDIREKE
jgi:hypothetical protein